MIKGNYKHLNEHDRVRIEVYLNEGKSQYEIAGLLKVDKSTICREIQKRGGIIRGYSADYAQEDYEREKQKGGVKSKIENFDFYLCSGREIVKALKQYLYQKGAPKEQVYFGHWSVNPDFLEKTS